MDSSSVLMCLILPLMGLQLLLLIATSMKRLPLPPGPLPLPIFGNMFDLRGNNPLKALTKLARTHGPLVSLRLGNLTVMVVSSVPMANEVLRKNDTFVSTRPLGDCMRAHGHHELSFVCLPVGNRWRSLRKICNTQIFSSSRLEASQNLRQRKVEELLCFIQTCCKDRIAVDIGQVAFTTTLNFLSNVIFSVDLVNFTSDASRDLRQLVWAISVETIKPNLADFFPVLRILDPQGVRRRMETLFTRLLDTIDKVIEQRFLEKSPANMARDRDLLDALLQENGEGFDHANILHVFMDLIVVGTESTSAIVEWTLAELLRNPDKLKKAKSEFEQVIGKGKAPFQEINISKLPYFEAVMKEAFRLHPVVPLIPRQVDAEIEVSGFRVPKNSRVWVNMYAMGRDPRAWESPDSFEPERFLRTEVGGEGRELEIIPFGGGRRICPAFPLAMKMVPLIVGSLVHSFDWELEHGADPRSLDMDEMLGVGMLKAQPLRVIPYTQRLAN